VAAIGPGQQVVFAMVLDLPATLRPGKGALVWQLLREPPPSQLWRRGLVSSSARQCW
jgi:hypothetical protein